jgi:hypothetical protein
MLVGRDTVGKGIIRVTQIQKNLKNVKPSGPAFEFLIAAAEGEAEAEADVPTCGDWVEVPRVDSASGNNNGKSHSVEACDTGLGKDEHHSSAGGSAEARVFPHFEKNCAGASRISENPGSGVVSVLNSCPVMNEVVPRQGMEGQVFIFDVP